MSIEQLRRQLDDLRKKETIARTREQLLLEEKEKLLGEVEVLFTAARKLELFKEEELTSSNLAGVVSKLQEHINSEIAKSQIPGELL